MKNNYFAINIIRYLLLILVSGTTLFLSCTKDEKTEIPNSLPNYFSIDGAKLVNETVPSNQDDTALIPKIDTLTTDKNLLNINNYIIDTLLVTADTVLVDTFSIPIYDTVYFVIHSNSSNLTKAYIYCASVGLEYYAVDIQNYKTAENEYTVPLIIFRQASSKFVVNIKLQNSDGYTSNAFPMALSIYKILIGKLGVTCEWDKDNDLDLSLTDPLGEILDVNAETNTSYPGIRRSTTNGYLWISNEGCIIDSSKEVIIYDDFSVIYLGEYIVYVDMFSHCGIDSITNFKVSLTVNDDTIQNVSSSNPYYGAFEADVLYRKPIEVMRFTLDENTLINAGTKIESYIVVGNTDLPKRIIKKQKNLY